MYGGVYKITMDDVLAKLFLDRHSIEVDAFKCEGGFRIWVSFPDGRDFLRKKVWKKEDLNYALNETYRSVCAKLGSKA